MIAGLPGNMATLVASQVAQAEDIELLQIGLAEREGDIEVEGISVGYVPLDQHEEEIGRFPPDIIVDFTGGEAVNRNAEMYCRTETPFVMGTTGGDREALQAVVEKSNISAVIAPNMAAQIVALQAMLEFGAENFPGVFEGYTLEVVESHQSYKESTSGTAKAMVGYFNTLGAPFSKGDIVKIRDPASQEKLLGVPKEHLNGHGWHKYTLRSPQGDVLFQIVHNVNGRDVYVRGVLDAIRFLYPRREEQGRVYSMIDVLRGGE